MGILNFIIALLFFPLTIIIIITVYTLNKAAFLNVKEQFNYKEETVPTVIKEN